MTPARPSGAFLAIAVLAGPLACAPEESPEAGEPGQAADSVAVADTLPTLPTLPEDPLAAFVVDADTPLDSSRVFTLALRNDRAEPVRVFADGGAGVVEVDTVPPGAVHRVDIESRAATIRLRSTPLSDTAATILALELSVAPDTIEQVLVGLAERP